MSENRKPLEGIRLIELANYVAAPIVGRIAADLGAEVIKIEGRGGDAWRATSMGHTKTGPEENPLFDIFNVGKKSISLNMKSEEGKEIFFKIPFSAIKTIGSFADLLIEFESTAASLEFNV